MCLFNSNSSYLILSNSLPVFAVAGMNPRRNRHFSQLPPTWDFWVDVLQLLVDYGASIHETIQSRPLGTFHVVRRNHGAKALQFLRLLIDQNYLDFGVVHGPQCWSALQTALRSEDQAVNGLKLLHSLGVDLMKVLEDGRSSLHLAAEWSSRSEVLEYLCQVECLDHINRQDKWGWTPLHYCVLSEFLGSCSTPFTKIGALLRNGADPEIKAYQMPFPFGKKLPATFTSLELSMHLQPSVSNSFIKVLKDAGVTVAPEMDEDPFQDALQTQNI